MEIYEQCEIYHPFTGNEIPNECLDPDDQEQPAPETTVADSGDPRQITPKFLHDILCRIRQWHYCYNSEEGLTRELFEETFGKVMGRHYYQKWIGEYKTEVFKMIDYFRPNTREGQLFCGMILRQTERYEKHHAELQSADRTNRPEAE